MSVRAVARTGTTASSSTRRMGAPEAPRGRWPMVRDGLALLAVVLGVLSAIVVFLPVEGRIAGPLHLGIALLLGWTSWELPLALLLVGGSVLARSVAPHIQLPLYRLLGLALVCAALVPVRHLVGQDPATSLARAQAGQGGGMVGHWLGLGLLDWLGAWATGAVLGAAIAIGLLLLFDVTVAQVGRVTAIVAVLLGRGLLAGGQRAAPVVRASGVQAFTLARRSRPRTLPTVRRPDWLHATSAPRLAARPRLSNRPPVQAPTLLARPAPADPDELGAQEWTRPQPTPPSVPAPQPRTTSLMPSPAPVPTATVVLDESGAEIAPSRVVDLGQRSAVAAVATTWRNPNVDIFQPRTAMDLDDADLEHRSRIIEDTLTSFNVEAHVVEVHRGPSITQFGIEPAPGVAVNKILSRQHDLALRLGASPIRLEAPVPGKRIVGLEVPNSSVATVTIRDVVEAPEWERAHGKLRLALGRDVSGASIVGDLGRMPHLLIAGATGAGKSVCINTIIGSLLYQYTPDELQLLLIDPKRVELTGYGEVPHLRLPVVTDMDKVVGALKWVAQEMDRRYKLFATHAVRNLDGYNRWADGAHRPDEPPLPYLVVVVDELADMMMTAAEDVEKLLCRLAQLARATGIHLVVATQRPSVDVLTGLIKANFPTRIAFAVSSQTDSRVILDQAGAEKLLGRGDALFMPTDAMKPVRLQGAFVGDDEIVRLVRHWSEQGQPRYTPEDVELVEALGRGDDEDDELYEKAAELAEKVGRVSTSLLQRRLGIGRDKAQRLLERLAEDGLTDE